MRFFPCSPVFYFSSCLEQELEKTIPQGRSIERTLCLQANLEATAVLKPPLILISVPLGSQIPLPLGPSPHPQEESKELKEEPMQRTYSSPHHLA